MGELIVDEVESDDRAQLTSELEKKGLLLISLEQKDVIFDFIGISDMFSSVSKRDISIYFKQIGTIFSAGVPLYETLQAVSDQQQKGKLKNVSIALMREIEGGSSFSVALSKYPKIFTHLIVAMVEAGEKAGMLGDVLHRISALLEKENKFEQGLVGAMRYPAMVLGVLALGFVFCITFIIPKFQSVFDSLGAKLPLPTRILIGINYGVRTYYLPILVFIIIAILLYNNLSKNRYVRRFLDLMKLSIPVLGDVNKKISLARFFTMLSAMLNSGINIVYALSVTADTSNNVVISEAVISMQQDIVAGGSLSEAMKKQKLFPSTAVQMAAIGEKSGNLSEMLSKTASYFDEEADYMLANLMVILEPLLIFVLAIFVAILALGIYLPSWSLIDVYQGKP